VVALAEEAYILDFCSRWLPAWTGNDPEGLLRFYAEQAFYRDPANPNGLKGHAQMRPYFTKLLAANPNWTWEAVEVFPTRRGFIMKWRATIPVGRQTITEYGMDIVELENGRVTRNEVFFDRTQWLTAMPSKPEPTRKK
jgi:hypothetical protein